MRRHYKAIRDVKTQFISGTRQTKRIKSGNHVRSKEIQQV